MKSPIKKGRWGLPFLFVAVKRRTAVSVMERWSAVAPMAATSPASSAGVSSLKMACATLLCVALVAFSSHSVRASPVHHVKCQRVCARLLSRRQRPPVFAPRTRLFANALTPPRLAPGSPRSPLAFPLSLFLRQGLSTCVFLHPSSLLHSDTPAF